MLRIAAFLPVLLAAAPAWAQFDAPIYVAPASSYTGPGDIVSGWVAWYGLRAFSGATAGTKAANICNSGDVNCTDVNTLANGDFDVTTAQAAPLNCGGTGGTCTIKTWYDKSGNGHDVSQATIASRPTLSFSCINTSLPCMVASASQSLGPATIGTIPNPRSVEMVSEQTSNTGNNQVLVDNASFISVFYASAGNTSLFCGSTINSAAATDNAFHAIEDVCQSGTGLKSITVDSTTSTFTETVAGPGGGESVTTPDPVNGTLKLTEVGIWNGAFSGANISALHANASSFWGTP